MPKLIVTSRYLKSGSGKRKQLYHYVKYIATREGSVPIPNANETAPATKSQQELISSLLHDFPDSKELFEYEDYQKNPTIKNGSALISVILDRNMDRLTSRENYIEYHTRFRYIPVFHHQAGRFGKQRCLPRTPFGFAAYRKY